MRRMIVTMSFVVVGLVVLPLINGAAAQEQVAEENQTTVYTCPMHPAVKSAEPGKCPTCGMALVKKGKEASPPAVGCCAGCMMGRSAKKTMSEDGMSMMQRCMAMMEKAGVSQQMMRRCRIMMRTSISMDSPNAIQSQAEALGLSEEQKKQLAEIDKDAKKKALAILTPEQRKKMGDIPNEPMAMMQMMQKMMCPMMQGIMKSGAKREGCGGDCRCKGGDCHCKGGDCRCKRQLPSSIAEGSGAKSKGSETKPAE